MRLSGLNVPILVQAYPDDVTSFTLERRRDAFCGKISVCSDLRQYGYAYTLTERHTVPVQSAEFRADLDSFVRVCKVANGMKTARLGAIGTRPDAFKTVRYSEKLLEASGIAVSVIDLSEIFGRAAKLTDDHAQGDGQAGRDPRPHRAPHGTAGPHREDGPPGRRHRRLDGRQRPQRHRHPVLELAPGELRRQRLHAHEHDEQQDDAVSACETDITGLASMYALQLAAGEPAAIVDLNNNYGDDPDKCVLFHCGNWPLNFYTEAEMKTAEVLGTTLGADNVWGAINGRAPAAPLTIARISTDDVNGICKAYVAEGRFLDDPLDTFGSRAVVEIPDFQPLLKYICNTGFEHHCAMSPSTHG